MTSQHGQNISTPTSPPSSQPRATFPAPLLPEERAAGSISSCAGSRETPPQPGLMQPLLARSQARHCRGSAAFVPSPSSVLTQTHTHRLWIPPSYPKRGAQAGGSCVGMSTTHLCSPSQRAVGAQRLSLFVEESSQTGR